MDEKDRHIITFDIDPEDVQTVRPEVTGSGFVMTPSEPEMPSAPESEKTEGAGFTMAPDAGAAAADQAAKADFNMSPSEPTGKKTEGAGFTMSPSAPEDKAQDLKKDFDTIGNDVKINMSKDAAAAAEADTSLSPRPEIRTSTTVVGGTDSGSGSASRSAVGSTSGSGTDSNLRSAASPTSGSRPGSGSGSGSGGSHYAAKPAKPAKEKKYVTRGALIACMILTMLASTLFGALLGKGFSGSSNPDDNRAKRNDSELSQLNLSDATGSELTVAEIVEKNADAVVEIVVSGTTQGMWGQMQLTEGAGSGVVIREDGYIATNYHVIQGANKVQVTLHNGNAYPAQIVGSDAANDIAVIKIDEKGLTTASIGDSSKVEVGDLAVAIGNPLGQLGGTATTGIISALDRTLSVEGTTLTLLQTDAAINGGNSGGGLFNSKGELIGIVESKASAVGVEGLAFALPINSVAEIINDIIETGGSVSGQTAGTPAVGIVISDVSEEQSQYYGLDQPGVYVAQVTGANAQQAGFREQDRLVSFNGTEITDSSTFISLVRKCKVGDTVTIVVSRGGQEIEIKTVLEELQTNQ